MMKALFSIIIVLSIAGSLAYSIEPMDNEQFDELIQGIRGSVDVEIFEIARSGHPRSLSVIRAFKGRHGQKWGPFKQEFGFPSNISDTAIIQLRPDNLQVALAIAGDKQAFDEITELILSEDIQVVDEGLKKLEKVGTPEAVKHFASLLNDERILHLYPVKTRAAISLHKLIPNPPAESAQFMGGKMTDDNKRTIWPGIWKDWWKRNQDRYEIAIVQGVPLEEINIDIDQSKTNGNRPVITSESGTFSSANNNSSIEKSASITPTLPATKWHLWVIGGLIVLVAGYWVYVKLKSSTTDGR